MGKWKIATKRRLALMLAALMVFNSGYGWGIHANAEEGGKKEETYTVEQSGKTVSGNDGEEVVVENDTFLEDNKQYNVEFEIFFDNKEISDFYVGEGKRTYAINAKVVDESDEVVQNLTNVTWNIVSSTNSLTSETGSSSNTTYLVNANEIGEATVFFSAKVGEKEISFNKTYSVHKLSLASDNGKRIPKFVKKGDKLHFNLLNEKGEEIKEADYKIGSKEKKYALSGDDQRTIEFLGDDEITITATYLGISDSVICTVKEYKIVESGKDSLSSDVFVGEQKKLALFDENNEEVKDVVFWASDDNTLNNAEKLADNKVVFNENKSPLYVVAKIPKQIQDDDSNTKDENDIEYDQVAYFEFNVHTISLRVGNNILPTNVMLNSDYQFSVFCDTELLTDVTVNDIAASDYRYNLDTKKALKNQKLKISGKYRGEKVSKEFVYNVINTQLVKIVDGKSEVFQTKILKDNYTLDVKKADNSLIQSVQYANGEDAVYEDSNYREFNTCGQTVLRVKYVSDQVEVQGRFTIDVFDYALKVKNSDSQLIDLPENVMKNGTYTLVVYENGKREVSDFVIKGNKYCEIADKAVKFLNKDAEISLVVTYSDGQKVEKKFKFGKVLPIQLKYKEIDGTNTDQEFPDRIADGSGFWIDKISFNNKKLDINDIEASENEGLVVEKEGDGFYVTFDVYKDSKQGVEFSKIPIIVRVKDENDIIVPVIFERTVYNARLKTWDDEWKNLPKYTCNENVYYYGIVTPKGKVGDNKGIVSGFGTFEAVAADQNTIYPIFGIKRNNTKKEAEIGIKASIDGKEVFAHYRFNIKQYILRDVHTESELRQKVNLRSTFYFEVCEGEQVIKAESVKAKIIDKNDAGNDRNRASVVSTELGQKLSFQQMTENVNDRIRMDVEIELSKNEIVTKTVFFNVSSYHFVISQFDGINWSNIPNYTVRTFGSSDCIAVRSMKNNPGSIPSFETVNTNEKQLTEFYWTGEGPGKKDIGTPKYDKRWFVTFDQSGMMIFETTIDDNVVRGNFEVNGKLGLCDAENQKPLAAEQNLAIKEGKRTFEACFFDSNGKPVSISDENNLTLREVKYSTQNGYYEVNRDKNLEITKEQGAVWNVKFKNADQCYVQLAGTVLINGIETEVNSYYHFKVEEASIDLDDSKCYLFGQKLPIKAVQANQSNQMIDVEWTVDDDKASVIFDSDDNCYYLLLDDKKGTLKESKNAASIVLNANVGGSPVASKTITYTYLELDDELYENITKTVEYDQNEEKLIINVIYNKSDYKLSDYGEYYNGDNSVHSGFAKSVELIIHPDEEAYFYVRREDDGARTAAINVREVRNSLEYKTVIQWDPNNSPSRIVERDLNSNEDGEISTWYYDSDIATISLSAEKIKDEESQASESSTSIVQGWFNLYVKEGDKEERILIPVDPKTDQDEIFEASYNLLLKDGKYRDVEIYAEFWTSDGNRGKADESYRVILDTEAPSLQMCFEKAGKVMVDEQKTDTFEFNNWIKDGDFSKTELYYVKKDDENQASASAKLKICDKQFNKDNIKLEIDGKKVTVPFDRDDDLGISVDDFMADSEDGETVFEIHFYNEKQYAIRIGYEDDATNDMTFGITDDNTSQKANMTEEGSATPVTMHKVPDIVVDGSLADIDLKYPESIMYQEKESGTTYRRKVSQVQIVITEANFEVEELKVEVGTVKKNNEVTFENYTDKLVLDSVEDDVYTYHFPWDKKKDGTYIVKAIYNDIPMTDEEKTARNAIVEERFVLDNTVPERVKIDIPSDIPKDNDNGKVTYYFNEDAGNITISVARNLVPIKEIKVSFGGNTVKYEKKSQKHPLIYDEEKRMYYAIFDFEDNQPQYEGDLSAWAVNELDNQRGKDDRESEYVIFDPEAPKVTFKYLREDQGPVGKLLSKLTGHYYQKYVVFEIDSTDNISPVTKYEYAYIKEGEEVTETTKWRTQKVDQSSDNNKEIVTIEGNRRGYLVVKAHDKAGNVSKGKRNEGEFFVVDDNDPKLTITYSNAYGVTDLNGEMVASDTTTQTCRRIYGADKPAMVTFSLFEENFDKKSDFHVVIHDVENKKIVSASSNAYTDTGWIEDAEKPGMYYRTIEITDNGEYQIEVWYKDLSGNPMVLQDEPAKEKVKSIKTSVLVMDKKKPTVEIVQTAGSAPESRFDEINYHKQKASFDILVYEKNFSKDNSKCVVVANGYKLTGEKVGVEPMRSEWTKIEGGYKQTITFDTDLIYDDVKVTACDIADNYSADVQVPKFAIDSTDPNVQAPTYSTPILERVIEAISFGYYQAPVVVTVKANDDISKMHSITYTYTKAADASGVNANSYEVVLTEESLKYSGDGSEATVSFELPSSVVGGSRQVNGTVKYVATNRAGRSAEYDDNKRLIVDSQKPDGLVTFNTPSQAGTNGSPDYYAENIVGTIAITEANFASEDVKVMVRKNNAEAQEVSVSWSNESVDRHVGHFTFQEEGTYQVSATYTDKSGNEMDSFESNQMIIDTKVPVIKMEGIRNRSANKDDKIGFIITVEDDNMDLAGFEQTLYLDQRNEDGSFSSVNVTALGKLETVTNGKSYKYTIENLERDGIYSISCNALDRAGNKTNEILLNGTDTLTSVDFSVNRYGSTYGLDDYTRGIVGNFATRLQDVVIYEVNPDKLKNIELTIYKDDQTITLEEGNDFEVTSNREPGEWYFYTYKIFQKNFEKDGVYQIAAYSEDEAGNVARNTLDVKGVNISFIVDQTAPTLIVTNLDSNKTYPVEGIDVNMQASDNMQLNSLKVVLDGKEVATWDKEQLKESSNNLTFRIPGDVLTAHHVAITLTDTAGNETTKVIEKFYVTTNLWLRIIHNKALLFGILAAGLVAIAGVGFFIVFFVKRRKENY